MKCGFQNECAARLGHVLSECESRLVSQSLRPASHNFPSRFGDLRHRHALFSSLIPARRARASFFSCFPYITTRGTAVRRTSAISCASFPSPSTAASRNCLVFDLFENLASRRKRFDKDCLLIADGIRNGMQIFERQRQILCERSVVRYDAEHGAPRAMRLQPAPAKSANRPIRVSRAGHVDLASDALAQPIASSARRKRRERQPLPRRIRAPAFHETRDTRAKSRCRYCKSPRAARESAPIPGAALAMASEWVRVFRWRPKRPARSKSNLFSWDASIFQTKMEVRDPERN